MSESARLQRLNNASHDLHVEEMTRFGGDLTWLQDPDIIPEDTVDPNGSLAAQCYDISFWMLERFGEWSQKRHSRLGLLEAFEKYELENADRVTLRQAYQMAPTYAYAPGVMAMTEVFAVVPGIAQREDMGRERWAEISSRAATFAIDLATEGTGLQALLRDYLKDEKNTMTRRSPANIGGSNIIAATVLDAGKLKLDDETGITTVTPFENLRAASLEALEEVLLGESSHACAALRARGPSGGCSNMFNAVWSAYGSAVQRMIYSRIGDDAIEVVSQGSEDENYRENLREELRSQMARANAAS
jgi:hypothetical protein